MPQGTAWTDAVAHRARTLLQLGTGQPQAQFRTGQEAAIRDLLAGPRRLLMVQRTGWGKSLVYFIAASLLREAGAGPTLLVSPLLALMRNQILAARRLGLRAAAIHGENRRAWRRVEAALAANALDLLLIAPERLADPRFGAVLFDRTVPGWSLLVVDEAHCLSDWGHDFRPCYRLLAPFLVRSGVHRLLATTATVNARVLEDLSGLLGPNLEVRRGPVRRDNLCLQVLHMPRRPERMAWLADTLPLLPGSGIIYALTIADAERLAAWLRCCGLAVAAYTGRSGACRPQLERDLLDNRLQALVATSALGMGFDKPDLAWVIHFQMPPSLLTYYQQVGRAGRALAQGRGILLCGEEDDTVCRHLVSRQGMEREQGEALLSTLAAAQGPMSPEDLAGRLQVPSERLARWLNLLATVQASPVRRFGSQWVATGASLGETFWTAAARRRRQREQELADMQAYTRLRRGHMTFLARKLGAAGLMAHLRVWPGRQLSALPPLGASVDVARLQAAAGFLQPGAGSLAPLEAWPAGLPSEAAGEIPRRDRARPGRVLCRADDPEALRVLAAVKGGRRRWPAQLIVDCRDLLLGWQPSPQPRWVTCVPSCRHPNGVPELAWRLAEQLDLPFMEVLEQTHPRPPPTLATAASPERLASLSSSLRLVRRPPAEPVLLVDDLAYTGLTLAWSARLLQGAGSGPVWPMVLASFVHLCSRGSEAWGRHLGSVATPISGPAASSL